MTDESRYVEALRKYWGYPTFRPLQEKIIDSIASGHDACVVMPTGGGKSLCYQLPAVLQEGRMTVVVSPLLALMQDQVEQLNQMGIPAAALNSTVTAAGQADIIERARRGEWRLLYISPERIMQAGTRAWLKASPLAFFVIDEAHCISEWGHDFRPDYRNLRTLRDDFPTSPMAAFTASATKHVRHDIIEQLRLRDPRKYIASFYRKNLRYWIHKCTGGEMRALLAAAVKNVTAGSTIVYVPTINKVSETAAFLRECGVEAVTYHGKMEAAERQRNQEKWMLGRPRVIVATIAFGLGINKPDVRLIVHTSLPKSIEQFYQESGRAGRDGCPADCVLLWQVQDCILQKYFIGQISDPAETERAKQRLRIIERFAESRTCRPHDICVHFGETPKWRSCGACDACNHKPAWLDAALTAANARPSAARSMKKKRRSSSSVGGQTSTRGSGILANAVLSGSSADRDGLRAALREWRLLTAREQKIPAFVILHDAVLDELCAVRPKSMEQLRGVYGFGEAKTERYGEAILRIILRF
jgi:ATP-dependent DNA helicase RecQ